MNRTWLRRYVGLLLLLAVGLVSQQAFSQLKDTVTFKVKMSVKMLEGKFKPSLGDTVRVVGSFNGWSATDTTVRMSSTGPTDSVYTVKIIVDSAVVHDDTVYYKFYKSPRGGDWESVSNRVHALVNGSHSTPEWYFDNDSTVNAVVSVTFRVNMAIKMRELTFQPANGDTVRAVGSFQSWSTTDAAARMVKNPSDSVYTVSFNANEGDQLFYKFYKKLRGGLDWESGQATTSGNREYTVPIGGGPIPVAYFDNDSVFNAAVQTNILWQVDMGAYTTLGWFDPTKDTIEVRGGFTGWSTQLMAPNTLTPNIWEFNTTSFIASIGGEQSYKFFIRFDSTSAKTRFPGIIFGSSTSDPTRNVDGYAYEHPANRGDGNNAYIIQNQTNQAPPRSWYSQINPQGLLGANDSVNVTLKVNMGPATRYSNAFNLAQDTLYLVWQDALWRSAQVKYQGAFAQTMKMSHAAGDSVYSITFKVKGKTHYNMQYTYRYIKADASTVDQGGGLGGQNPFITRFIPKTGSPWPASYTAPEDKWQKDAPLPGESAQFVTSVASENNVPLRYDLAQNYPNPFNPTTTISFVLPKASKATLKVFNLLGQEVATLVDDIRPAGVNVIAFDASRLSTGVYFYTLHAGDFRQTKKMVLVK